MKVVVISERWEQLDNWFHLNDYEASEEIYTQLRLLGRQYSHYIPLCIESKQSLENMLDYTMPGIKKLLQHKKGNDKLIKERILKNLTFL